MGGGGLFVDDEDFMIEFRRSCENSDIKEVDDDFDLDSVDHHLSMKLSIGRGEEHPEFAKVTKSLKDHRGNPIGIANDDPMQSGAL